MGVMMAPDAFASDHTDTSAYGTVEIEKSQYELRQGQSIYIKVFGVISPWFICSHTGHIQEKKDKQFL